MVTVKIVYESPLVPSVEGLTTNIRRHETLFGELVSTLNFVRPKASKLGEDHNIVIGVFRKK